MQSDMPVIINGPRPECRKCKANDDPHGIAGCLLVATLATRAALAALLAATREPSEAMILAEGNAIVACEHRGDVWRAVHDALARELGVGE